ncbi:MAG TPA: hypothetical protein VFU21_30660, partial [Kofleriaceae bacterium]|nr:hypothetical protein [Kofleriaceae bacterium]
PVAAAAPPARPAPAREAASAPRAVAVTTGEAPPAPPSGQQSIFVPTAADQVFVRRMLDAIDEIAAAMERHKDACDRMATDLEGIVRRNQDLFAMARQMKGDPAREKWMQEQAMPRLEKALPRMMAGMQNCQNDARMQALMRQLGS